MRLYLLPIAFLFLGTLTRAAEERPPNVVIIFIDDQGYADIGPFGAPATRTPNLDRMAQEGRKFTNFHVAQPVCSASRAALLTGCYPNRIGISGALAPRDRRSLDPGELTLAEMLRGKGYATGMAGKWHLGSYPAGLPLRHGFDEFLGLPYSNDMWPRHPEAKAGTYPPLPLLEGEAAVNPAVGPEDQDELTRLYTERAVRFIEGHRAQPFFFYLAHSMVHVPLHVGSRFRGKSGEGLYGDACMEVDWSVGEVFAALRRAGVEQNTLVIYTSDNGPWLSYGNHAGSAGPHREGKGTNWEGGTREPCLMWWPGKIPAGTVSRDMLMTIDLLPSLAGLLGAPLPAHPIDGLDVWPLILGTPGAKNPHAGYAYYYRENDLQAVSSGDGRWKLQFPHAYTTLGGRPGGRDGTPAKYEMHQVEKPELYDLEADPGEAHECSADHPEVLASLQAYAETVRADLGDNLTKRPPTGARKPALRDPE